MKSSIATVSAASTAAVMRKGFGPKLAPLPLAALADQERELRIQAEGLLMRAEMLAWERTGALCAHGAATWHKGRMQELIKGRSAAVQARMAAERGLPA